MKINPEISRRIKVLRFPLIVCIVCIHSSLLNPYQNQTYLGAGFAEFFISWNLSRVAVPLLFIISGYLFFVNFDMSGETYRKKLKSRVRNLLIPYLFWNLSYWLMLFLWRLFKNLKSPIRAEEKIQFLMNPDHFFDLLNAVTGFYNFFPALYQFWYVRDLIILIILAPLFWFLAKKLPYIVLLLLAVPWLIDGKIERLSSLFFYCGCLLAIKNWDVTKFDRYKLFILPTYLILVGIIAGFQSIEIEPALIIPWANLTILLGIIMIWSMTDALNPQVENALSSLSGFSFFVYATHEPLITQIKITTHKLGITVNPLMQFFFYFALIIFTVILTLFIAFIIRKYTPKFYELITGSRNY